MTDRSFPVGILVVAALGSTACSPVLAPSMLMADARGASEDSPSDTASQGDAPTIPDGALTADALLPADAALPVDAAPPADAALPPNYCPAGHVPASIRRYNHESDPAYLGPLVFGQGYPGSENPTSGTAYRFDMENGAAETVSTLQIEVTAGSTSSGWQNGTAFLAWVEAPPGDRYNRYMSLSHSPCDLMIGPPVAFGPRTAITTGRMVSVAQNSGGFEFAVNNLNAPAAITRIDTGTWYLNVFVDSVDRGPRSWTLFELQ